LSLDGIANAIEEHIQILSLMGNVMKKQGKYDQAIKILVKANTLCIENKLLEKLSYILFDIASVFFLRKNFKQAKYYQKKGICNKKCINNTREPTGVSLRQ